MIMHWDQHVAAGLLRQAPAFTTTDCRCGLHTRFIGFGRTPAIGFSSSSASSAGEQVNPNPQHFRGADHQPKLLRKEAARLRCHILGIDVKIIAALELRVKLH
ncbi:hypothetical protein ACJ5NV_04900 [Loktanella agnita]